MGREGVETMFEQYTCRQSCVLCRRMHNSLLEWRRFLGHKQGGIEQEVVAQGILFELEDLCVRGDDVSHYQFCTHNQNKMVNKLDYGTIAIKTNPIYHLKNELFCLKEPIGSKKIYQTCTCVFLELICNTNPLLGLGRFYRII